MARATTCIHNGQVIEVGEAIRLRDQANAHNLPYPDFRCVECDARVRPHNAGGHGGAHMEHRDRNPQCSLSDPAR